MPTVTSRDGTTIAYEQSGHGPTVILVAAALSDRADTRKLAALLATDFTVINYDRRGRGESGDTQPYAVEREIDDLEALIELAGGSSAHVFGSSSGAVLALRAAANGLAIDKLALFEPPFMLDAGASPLPSDYDARLTELLRTGRRSDAVKYFMTKAVGVPGPFVLLMRAFPGLWSKMTAMAHTLLYDQAVMGDTIAGRPLRASDWATVRADTLVIDGAKSADHFRSAVECLVEVLPHARRQTLAGQNHGVVEAAPKSIAPVLREFFAA